MQTLFTANQFQIIEENLEIEFYKALQRLANIIENNTWHHNDNMRQHSLSALQHMAENLTFSYIINAEKQKQLKNFYTAKYKETNFSRGQLILIAVLLHDLGVPEVLQKNAEGQDIAPQHAEKGAEIAKTILNSKKYPEDAVNFISKLIKYHMIIHGVIKPDRPDSAESIRLFQRNFGNISTDLILLGLADTQASQLEELSPKDYIQRIKLYHNVINAVY